MYGIDSYYDLFLNAKNIPKRINQSIEINGKTVKLFLLEDKEALLHQTKAFSVIKHGGKLMVPKNRSGMH